MITIAEYAEKSLIPKRVFSYLNRAEIIQDPLRNEDLLCLQFLERVWCDRELLRSQLRRFSFEARTSLIRTANLDTKWERYAYSRFYNQEEGAKLPMHRVIDEIETTFHFQLSKQHIKRLCKVRNRAQVAKHREKKLLKFPAEKTLLQSTNKEKETAFIARLPDEQSLNPF